MSMAAVLKTLGEHGALSAKALAVLCDIAVSGVRRDIRRLRRPGKRQVYICHWRIIAVNNQPVPMYMVGNEPDVPLERKVKTACERTRDSRNRVKARKAAVLAHPFDGLLKCTASTPSTS